MDINAVTAASIRSPQPRASAGAGAIGSDFKGMVAQAAARPQAPKLPADPREFIPDYASGAPQAQTVPSEAEARIQAAQIAADANVFAPFKQNQIKQAAAPVPQVTPGRFLPINRAPVVPQGQTIQSRAIAPTTVESLRATSKFAPGSTGAGTAAALAAAQRARAAETPVVTTPAAPAPAAADLPPWFAEAQRNLDKYDALKGRAKTP